MIQPQTSTTTQLTGDAPPNQTLYINNLNEKVKIEGIEKIFLFKMLIMIF